MTPAGSRECNRCGKTKPIEQFRVLKRTSPRRYTYREGHCKVCQKIKQAEYDRSRQPRRRKRPPQVRDAAYWRRRRRTELGRAKAAIDHARERVRHWTKKLADATKRLAELKAS